MKKLLLFIATFVILFTGCDDFAENTVVCVQLDPLEKVFTEESYFVENDETAAVAKGETATFQFVVRSAYPIQNLKIDAGNLVSGDRQIAATLKAFVGYIRAGKHAGDRKNSAVHRSKDAVFPVSDYYPDCLKDIETVDVQPMQNQPIWVSYAVPRDAMDGDYTATIVFTGKINGKQIKFTKEVNAKVYPVALPEQSLWVTNWWFSNGFAKMNGDQPVEMYSDRWWELLGEIAHVTRDHRQNVYMVGGPNVYLDGKQFSFDFTTFDKTVEFLIREGGLKRIEGHHLAGRPRGDFGWKDDFHVSVPYVGYRPLSNDTTQNYLSQYLSALYSHLEAKGWTSMYIQHIADEPIDENAASYSRIADFVKKFMPGIPLVDAVMSHKLANTVNIWVPVLDQYHKEYPFYQERQAAGDEIWFYTCVVPQDNYANRFLEQPLSHTRFLHWINFRYGSTGYLHWGLNFWDLDKTNDASSYGETWAGGEAWIVYPTEGRVFSSIRLAAMRDGIADYELLKLLEQKAPDKSKELAANVIKDFDNYNSNVRAFRLTRLELLEALCE